MFIYRLAADVINDLTYCIELLAPRFREYFLIFACLSSICRVRKHNCLFLNTIFSCCGQTRCRPNGVWNILEMMYLFNFPVIGWCVWRFNQSSIDATSGKKRQHGRCISEGWKSGWMAFKYYFVTYKLMCAAQLSTFKLNEKDSC